MVIKIFSAIVSAEFLRLHGQEHHLQCNWKKELIATIALIEGVVSTSSGALDASTGMTR